MFSRIKSTIMAVAILSIIFLGQNAFAEDSGPFVWDFLLFGNLDLSGGMNAGTLTSGSNGTTYNGIEKTTGTGYGLGFGTEVWFTDNVAARVLLQGNIFSDSYSSGAKNGPLAGYAAATVGPVFKLYGSQNYFVYAPVDIGYAVTEASAGNPATMGSSSSLTAVQGGSLYGDVGIGLNIRLITIEAKAAYLNAPGPFGGNSLFFPISIGFDL